MYIVSGLFLKKIQDINTIQGNGYKAASCTSSASASTSLQYSLRQAFCVGWHTMQNGHTYSVVAKFKKIYFLLLQPLPLPISTPLTRTGAGKPKIIIEMVDHPRCSQRSGECGYMTIQSLFHNGGSHTILSNPFCECLSVCGCTGTKAPSTVHQSPANHSVWCELWCCYGGAGEIIVGDGFFL